MSGPDQTNALTEIGLALAMAFFALMILTMVSMGAGRAPADAAVLKLVAAARPDAGAGARDTARAVRPDDLILFTGDGYVDAALRPVDPAATAGRPGLVLALPPELSMAAAQRARDALAAEDVTVTVFDAGWQTTLKELKP